MRRLALLLALSSLSIAGCTINAPPDEKSPETVATDQQEIIGGTVDNTNTATVFVYSQSDGTACSGTLISVNGNYGYILTAAHCTNMQYIVFGTDYTTGQQYAVGTDTVDPQWNGDPSNGHDFRILRFSGANANMTVVPAASNPDGLSVGTMIDISGYGLTSYPNGQTTQRRHVTVPISALYTDLMEYNQTGGKGACEGDSGGPAYATVNGQKMVVGVTSFGDQTCTQFGDSGRVQLDYNSFIAPTIGGQVMETCDSCFASATASGGACYNQVSTCLNDMACSNLVDCINNCNGSQTCVNTCASNSTNAAIDEYNAIFDCAICNTCSTLCDTSTCGSSTTTTTSTTSGGPGATTATSADATGAGSGGAGNGAGGAGGSDSSGSGHSGTHTVTTCACTAAGDDGGEQSFAFAGALAGLGAIITRRRTRRG